MIQIDIHMILKSTLILSQTTKQIKPHKVHHPYAAFSNTSTIFNSSKDLFPYDCILVNDVQ